ncbi:hypothetical protein N7470_007792 [Penicillium chermesinum]|nr:hypothetical protein N7470_007792 [Penicillium chermesinum]
MFYSHEILTSPEHGVATIWLVATLGSRSITRRFNRKAIFDVDVPSACRVIINPEAPMALRLQGNLLYGVSRVYHQQCGYTLLDVQAMHDKMVTMLRLLPGGGLDPSAGKTKPSNLVLPYDPSFLPETNLPGINVELPFIDLTDPDIVFPPSQFLARSPSNSHSSLPKVGNVQLELPSEDDLVGVDLQPDFEFDEDGNIIEFDPSMLSPRKRRKTATPRASGMLDEQMKVSEDKEQDIRHGDEGMDITMQDADQDILQKLPAEEAPIAPLRRARQQRARKLIATDDSTTLRNTDLANANNNYLTNMALARQQKQLNKQQTVIKKNAEFWVLLHGIGSVGVGLGADSDMHPLSAFSGTALYEALCGEPASDGPQVVSPGNKLIGNPGLEIGPSPPRDADVEVARDAPASLPDEHSSQMPWNITASLQSSRFRLGSGEGQLGGRQSARMDDELEARDIAAYLEGELATDNEDISVLSRRISALGRAAALLDRESANFFEFLRGRLEEADGGQLCFSELLPPGSTSAVVATQGLMDVLTLATKGLLKVEQDEYEDTGEGFWGKRYRDGEIRLRLGGI